MIRGRSERPACKASVLQYDSYMAMNTIPLAMPADLLDEVRRTADDTHLSSADVMRQAIKAGLPRVREALAVKGSGLTTGLKPFTKEEARKAFGPNAEFDALEHHCARLPARPAPDDE